MQSGGAVRLATACLILGLVMGLMGAATSNAQAPKPVALVIGNAAYGQSDYLEHPARDVAKMAAAFQRRGFVVQSGTNLTRRAMEKALADFSDVARRADVAVIYYSGHAIALNGRNYLVPVDARLNSGNRIRFETVPLELLTEALTGTRGTRMILLDASRDNPFLSTLRRSATGSQVIGRGLAAIEPVGDIRIGLSAKPGTVAEKGAGDTSVYTTALLTYLRRPRWRLEQIPQDARGHVMRSTAGRQEPVVYPLRKITRRDDDDVPQVDETDTKPAPTDGDTPSDDVGVDDDKGSGETPGKSKSEEARAVWETVKETDSIAILRTFVDRYPDGIYGDLARARIAEIERERERRKRTVRTTPDDPAVDRLPSGRWFVIMGSYPTRQRSRAEARLRSIRRRGLDAHIINTNRYRNLRNGLYAVVMGPTSRRTADRLLRRARRVIRDSYVKSGG